jgi:hypothetical protein
MAVIAPGQRESPQPTQRSKFSSGAWLKVLLLVLIVGMFSGFIAGFWVGIMGLCFGVALISPLPTK